MPPQDGINHLSRAAVVVAAVTLVILGITFLQSVFEAHAGELAALEERVAESKKAEDALAAEIVSIKASMLEAEGKLRTNVRQGTNARASTPLQARRCEPAAPATPAAAAAGLHAPADAQCSACNLLPPFPCRRARVLGRGERSDTLCAPPSVRADAGGGARQDGKQAGGARPAAPAQERLWRLEARCGGLGAAQCAAAGAAAA
eukprot:5180912-Prymnesium_polylepis.2